jgi:hypothetical protein
MLTNYWWLMRRLQENVSIKIEKFGIHFFVDFYLSLQIFWHIFFFPLLLWNQIHVIVSFQKKRFNCFLCVLRHLISSFENSPTYHRKILWQLFQKKCFNCFLCIATPHFIISKLTDLSSSPFKRSVSIVFMHCDTSFHHFKTHRLIIVSFQKKRFNCFLCVLRHLISSFENSPTYHRLLSKETF